MIARLSEARRLGANVEVLEYFHWVVELQEVAIAGLMEIAAGQQSVRQAVQLIRELEGDFTRAQQATVGPASWPGRKNVFRLRPQVV